jgi:hypothetical protein
MELPAMVVVFGFPVDGEGRPGYSVRIYRGEAVEDKAAGEAIGPLPGIAFDFDAQSAAVVRACAGGGGEGQDGQEAANCKSP